VSTGGRGFREAGYTIAELMVVIVVLGILWAASAPTFRRATEQARRDRALARLDEVWTAERIYWARHARFASSIGELAENRLLDPAHFPANGAGPFDYQVTSADGATFAARAVRCGTAAYEGHFSIDQGGHVEDTLIDAP
jgi:prepilin-type N-terminal cleavage/methylation domain-containing protein